MATNKTLNPTGVTIAIPAMTDKPDASVFSNCVDKEADAINALNSKLETGTNFDFTLNSSQTSQFEINKMRAKKFGGIYILCLVLNPLVDIGTGEIQLGEVSRAPGLNTATIVTRNSDTKPVGGANLLENKKLYMRLTESVNQGNLIYISFATTDA